MNRTFEELSTEELNSVSGGNTGDSKTDNNSKYSRYQVGQEVEVYTTALHISTRRCRITEAMFDSYNQYWLYTCQRVDGSSWFILAQNLDNPTCVRVTASDIQR